MIVQMEKLVLHAFSEDKMEILDRLMALKCVQLVPPEQMTDYDAVTPLAKRDAPGTYEYETKLSEISSALGVLLEYEPKPGLFAKKKELPLSDLLSLRRVDEALKVAASVKGVVANIAEVRSFMAADQFLRQSLAPWESLDVRLDALETRTASVMLFTLPLETGLDALRASAAEMGCVMELVSSDNELHYVAVAALQRQRDEVTQLLRERNALPVNLPSLNGTAAENLAAIDKRDEQNNENVKVLTESLMAQAKDASVLKEAFDELTAAIGEQKAKQNLMLTEQTFVACAWVPAPEKERVDKALSRFTCHYEYRAPEDGEEPPVKFKNSKLVEPFECITEMYGFPLPSSLDPNPLIAPFFFIFFGMMLSDAGYGILLLVAGWLVSKLVSKDGLMYKMTRMISICGVSTILWGAVFGGWFGDVVTQFSKAFLHIDITIPALINPLEEPMTILILSLALGIVHLFVGMGAKAYLLIRRGHFWDAVFDVGFWYLVLGGLILLLVGNVLEGLGVLGTIGMWAAILGAVGLLCTGGRDKPSFFGKITGGLGSLYDITSYFSDILSYSRILALGLATGVIAMVVNILATMVGGNILGFIVFVAVFLFGHALNLAINALGSYVHTSRLQYVEFFGKFYEGGGRPFAPLRANTKYHLIETKEEL